MTPAVLPLQSLGDEAFAPFGRALGVRRASREQSAGSSTYVSPQSDFWREHLFDTGTDGPTELLWVTYRSDEREVDRLEKHLLTEQALIPLNGEIVQVVACSDPQGRPDLATLTAFRVLPGQGLCMAPHCWHATRVPTPVEVRCAMLTRASTTRDLVRALREAGEPTESAFAAIEPHVWQA